MRHFYKILCLSCITFGCSTEPHTETTTKEGHVVNSSLPAPAVSPENPLEPQDGETREHFLGRQISQIENEITQLQPKVIAAENKMDSLQSDQGASLKEKLFALERQKASLELQLLSLP